MNELDFYQTLIIYGLLSSLNTDVSQIRIERQARKKYNAPVLHFKGQIKLIIDFYV